MEETQDGVAPSLPAREAANDADARTEETSQLLEAGPGSGNRAGAFAFLALVVVIAAAVHFYLADKSPDSYVYRLDAELVSHAELALASSEDGGRMAVVPTWPVRLYEILRRDIALYAAAAALAAYVWGHAARARARRDAYLVFEKLRAEMADLRARIDTMDGGARSGAERRPDDKKG